MSVEWYLEQKENALPDPAPLSQGSRQGKVQPNSMKTHRRRDGNAYEVPSPNSAALWKLFHAECEKHGVLHDPDDCFRFIADLPEQNEQLSLF